MSSASDGQGCGQAEQVFLYAVEVLPPGEAAAVEAHLADCAACRQELETLNPVVDGFADWPVDVLRPRASLWARVADRIAEETGQPPAPADPEPWAEPEWTAVAPGITCKLLATDTGRHRVSMLVRLAPGTDYPPHTHGGVEELHLIAGELYINERKLCPGEYSRAEPGTVDARVWSETGCTCVLMTSTRDVFR